MYIATGENIDGWVIKIKLENKEDVVIGIVTNENIAGNWIIKIKDNSYTEEIPLIEKYIIGCENAIKIPKNIKWHGTDKERSLRWYVMEQYRGDISKNFMFARKNWKLLLSDVLNFFKHIHLQGIIHGDIKTKNILYRETPVKFCVNDYEFVGKPTKNNINTKKYVEYYYSYLGIPHGKQWFGYRADLTAFGYILWNVLVANKNGEQNLLWQLNAIDYYNKRETRDYHFEIDLDRNLSIELNMPNMIKNYFNILESLEWNRVEPPESSLYDELNNVALFEGAAE